MDESLLFQCTKIASHRILFFQITFCRHYSGSFVMHDYNLPRRYIRLQPLVLVVFYLQSLADIYFSSSILRGKSIVRMFPPFWCNARISAMECIPHLLQPMGRLDKRSLRIWLTSPSAQLRPASLSFDQMAIPDH